MLRTLPFCDVNAPMIDGFPSQRASSAGIASMPWRYDKILQIIRVWIATPPISQNLSYKLHAIFRVFNGINILRRYDEVNSSFILMHHTCHGLVATWRPAAWGWFSCQECYRPESKNPPITWNQWVADLHTHLKDISINGTNVTCMFIQWQYNHRCWINVMGADGLRFIWRQNICKTSRYVVAN